MFMFPKCTYGASENKNSPSVAGEEPDDVCIERAFKAEIKLSAGGVKVPYVWIFEV